jgi:pantoate--beta-alanine ligase
VREPDGLASSSRNRYLGPEDRQRALVLYRSLTLAMELIAAGERDANTIRQHMHNLFDSTQGVSVDYATLVDPETLEEVMSIQGPTLAVVAARVGKARLIDNLMIRP